MSSVGELMCQHTWLETLTAGHPTKVEAKYQVTLAFGAVFSKSQMMKNSQTLLNLQTALCSTSALLIAYEKKKSEKATTDMSV
jgi:hypothetical protein